MQIMSFVNNRMKKPENHATRIDRKKCELWEENENENVCLVLEQNIPDLKEMLANEDFFASRYSLMLFFNDFLFDLSCDLQHGKQLIFLLFHTLQASIHLHPEKLPASNTPTTTQMGRTGLM